MRGITLSIALILYATSAWAQGGGGGGGIAPVTALPATCTPGGTNAQVNLTTGTKGFYSCTATNTFTYIGGGAAGPTGATGPAGPAGSTGPAGANGTNGAGYAATSTSSITVGTGSKSFTTQAGLAYSTGARARASASPTDYVEGAVTSYSGTTLVINVDTTGGSGGTFTSWNINVAGNVGATGPAGSAGSTGATGPAGPTGATGPAGTVSVGACGSPSGATPTFTLSAPVSTCPMTLSTNVTSITMSGAAASYQVTFQFTQPVAGNITVAAPSGFNNWIQPAFGNGIVTTFTCAYDATATTATCGNAYSTATYGQGVEGSAPGSNPPSGYVFPYNSSSTHTMELLNSAGNTFSLLLKGVDINAATGQVTNLSHVTNGSLPVSGLFASSTTVNGQACTLGSTCTIPLSAINAQTATYQVLPADFSNYKTISVASGTFTITLVAAGSQPANGQYINIVNYGSGVVTVARSGQSINGGTSSLTLAAGSATSPTSTQIWSDGTNYFASVNAAGSGSVSSISGDGALITNSGSSGAVTLTLGNALAHRYWGNNTGSTTAPAYVQPACGDLSDGSIFCAATGATNAQTATYQVLAADFTNLKPIIVASGTFTITLVASGSQPANGKYITVVNYGSGVVTIARSGQNINGGTSSLTLPAASATAPASAMIISDGTNYFGSVITAPALANITGLGTGVGTWLGTPSSANLAAALTDETGSGAAVFATSPTLVTPTLGAATATSINKMAITAPATSSTLAVADGKTATISNTLTFTGTDSSSVAFGAGGTATKIIASGTSALGTSSISTASCATVVTTSATGTASTDSIIWNPNASIKAVTGYVPATTGGLTISAYPTANNVNFDVCNWTSGSITPGAVTINWLVVRSM